MMRASVDRELVKRLLQDETLSFREIARQAQCSDWSVRSIARELADSRPSEPLTLTQWAILAGVLVVVLGGICFASWRTPPLNGGPMA
jgi:hypothetical protein